MTRLEEIERTYCLNKIEVEKWIITEKNVYSVCLCVKLVSSSRKEFVGCGNSIDEMEQNCVEVFEIHQELWRKGLLTTKNLN